MPIFFGAVADHVTGGTDLAGVLADRGMRPVLILDEPWREDFARWTRDADAVVIATASRIGSADAAYDETRRAIRLLETVDPQLLQVQYLGDMDSSEVHIGASIDAAMDETHQEFTIALPDLNAQAAGHNLLAYLQAHSKRRIGLLSLSDIARGPLHIRERVAQLHKESIGIAVAERTSRQDLKSICEAVSDLRLVTGSSALAMHLPLSWSASTPLSPKRRKGGRGFLVLAGSASPTSQQQNAWLAAHHAVVITLDATNLAAGTMPDSVLTPICEELASGGTCLLQISSHTEHVHEHHAAPNKPSTGVRETVARSLASFVRDLINFITPEGLIVSGAETAGILARVLGFGALAVGPNIEPGIPVCVTLSGSALPVVLKSGNAGTDGFYQRAIETIRRLEYLDAKPAGMSATQPG